MNEWMWDVLGATLVVFVLALTVADVLVSVVLVAVIRRWWRENRQPRPGGHRVRQAAPGTVPPVRGARGGRPVASRTVRPAGPSARVPSPDGHGADRIGSRRRDGELR